MTESLEKHGAIQLRIIVLLIKMSMLLVRILKEGWEDSAAVLDYARLFSLGNNWISCAFPNNTNTSASTYRLVSEHQMQLPGTYLLKYLGT